LSEATSISPPVRKEENKIEIISYISLNPEQEKQDKKERK
jgi:hypothetical protein